MYLKIKEFPIMLRLKEKDFHLVLLHGFTGDLKHGTLSLSNGVINGHVFALILSVMERSDSPEDIKQIQDPIRCKRY